MAYRFSLQRLLNLRQQHERAMARDLAQAQDARTEEEQVHDVLRRVRAEGQDRMARETAESPTVGTLLSIGHAMRHLDAHVELAHERLRAADAVVQQRHDALAAAAQARQILDRLRSRHELEFRSEENARDQQTMDEIALTRHGQPDGARMTRNGTNR